MVRPLGRRVDKRRDEGCQEFGTPVGEEEKNGAW